MSFQQRKKDILEKKDKSSIGKWDSNIADLCERINAFESYYTTSSCSGRIVIIKDQDKREENMFEFVSHDLVGFENLRSSLEGKNGDFKFKQEPPILHVACETLEGAEKLLNKARESGWKRSGVISLGKNIIVELISTEKIEFPIIKEGKLLVEDAFLRVVLEKANENLQKGWKKIENLKKS